MNPLDALTPTTNRRIEPLRQAANELEVNFLTEMLESAGLQGREGGFGGGVGEDQFTSFLVEAQARQIVDSGGIGLAEALYKALVGLNNGE